MFCLLNAMINYVFDFFKNFICLTRKHTHEDNVAFEEKPFVVEFSLHTKLNNEGS